mmetsp:Transcript_30108/g.60744  ORF Transcript_30108/g.60744 Transcript_30108/m.60744 type:complete len:676 (-) Transcript_30108:104-2131(-)|eukprot:CAMPEP_0171342898 /NCGR_PEP_ID=MMETSP0878-20121228/15681_1 /TAXON_ID=67004 /ORGANISM="Thalassiosira weissflogii, Strain CCMP1336" /LENGTH=675 /DNA_ID=CAMNT_0011845701 /DNA_START=175 /DNA_END=2202 /DNA_ORIENTATION=+
MKVETPQILWHDTSNGTLTQNGKSSPLLSCSLLDCRFASSAAVDRTAILATAGTAEVNLWRVTFAADSARTNKPKEGDRSRILVSEHTKIEHALSLSRGSNERTMNAVKFSPDGRHLAAAGDGGTVVVWSVPPAAYESVVSTGNVTSSKTVNRLVARFWSKKLDKETDLYMKIVMNPSDDVMDIAWSYDSKRFMVCSLDHTLLVHELSGSNAAGKPEWRSVHRSSKDHTHYIQGVAYDPKGVYMASQGSDRSVKVYSRKNVKGNAVKEALSTLKNNVKDGEAAHLADDNVLLQAKVLPHLLTNSKFDLQNKTKTIKFLYSTKPNENSKASLQTQNEEIDVKNPKKYHMFADELTVGSFFRRLSFTPDGSFLVVPAALWHGDDEADAETKITKSECPKSVVNESKENKLQASFATYLFARHHFDRPYKVLAGLDKPSVVVRPNPVLFKLPKENVSKAIEETPALPYRSIFAVLTTDTILIYDTYQDRPLSMACGLHYAGLTDAAWSADGQTLFVTSSDGYVSILSFANGELGEVYHDTTLESIKEIKFFTPATNVRDTNKPNSLQARSMEKNVTTPSPASKAAPSEDKGNEAAINTLVPKKKMKRISPDSTSTTQSSCQGGGTKEPEIASEGTVCAKATDETNQNSEGNTVASSVGDAVQQPMKKKKRIQPILLSP